MVISFTFDSVGLGKDDSEGTLEMSASYVRFWNKTCAASFDRRSVVGVHTRVSPPHSASTHLVTLCLSTGAYIFGHTYDESLGASVTSAFEATQGFAQRSASVETGSPG